MIATRTWIASLLVAAVSLAGNAAHGQVTDDSNTDSNADARIEETLTLKQSFVPVDDELYKLDQRTKRQITKSTGIDFALESTTIYQIATGSREANQAFETTTTLFGTWTVWRDENKIDVSGFGLSIENRSNYSGPSFVDMTRDLGTLWSPNDSTSDDYTKIPQLWWGQRLFEGKFSYVIGVVDPGTYINGNRFAGSGNTQFFGQPFATNPARTFSDNGLGGVARFAPVKWFQIQGEITNGDGRSTHSPFTTVNGNWFKAGEVVFIPQVPGLGEGRYRAMIYQQDNQANTTTGWVLSFDQNIGPSYGVFFRFANNDGKVNAIERLASTGVSWLKPFGRKDDQAGVGVSWTHPSDGSQRDEYSAEIYYRIQLTNFVELSPSVQMICHPSASDEDVIGVFGLRLRVLF